MIAYLCKKIMYLNFSQEKLTICQLISNFAKRMMQLCKILQVLKNISCKKKKFRNSIISRENSEFCPIFFKKHLYAKRKKKFPFKN